jgi:transcriptional regulator with XRE-family HTH domain
MSVGQNLKTLRANKGMTQGQLADAASVGLNQISRIERDSAKPELDTIKKLAKALNCSADSLIFDESEREPASDLKLLFEAVTRLPEDKKEIIREFLEAMVMKSDAEQRIKK